MGILHAPSEISEEQNEKKKAPCLYKQGAFWCETKTAKNLPPANGLVSGKDFFYELVVIRCINVKVERISVTITVQDFYQCFGLFTGS